MVANMVATKAAPKSMPASDKIAGFTAMINAIVRKVLNPANSSERMLTPCC